MASDGLEIGRRDLVDLLLRHGAADLTKSPE
jgi:hypothetical protein